MSNDILTPKKPGKGKAIAGLVLLFFGAILLFQQLNFFIAPWWLFRWPMILIIIGIYTGAKHNFRNSGWLIMVIIGGLFLFDDIFPNLNVDNFIWPVVLILVGLYIILGKDKFNKSFGRRFSTTNHPDTRPWNATEWDAKVNADPHNPTDPASTETAFGSSYQATGDEHLDTTSVFGSVHKTVLSKNFQGGEVVNVFGGTELNFTQADIQGRVYIDVTQLFGGIKIIVPPHWQVTSDMAAIFAGIDDKRRPGGVPLNAEKTLILKGTSIFAGVEVRAY